MTIKTASIRIPKRFYDDHVERDLDAPGILNETKGHYYIDALSPYLDELLSDAEYYAAMANYMDDHVFGICVSARATARAIRAALS
jgi:hypothetical protein